MRISITITTTLLILCIAFSASGRWSGFKASVFLEPGYDSNPGILTEEDKENFADGDPYYMEMKSTDDYYLMFGGDIAYRYRLKKIKMESGLNYRYKNYFYNRELSYHYLRPRFEFRRKQWRGEFYCAFVFDYATSIYSDDDFPDEIPVWATYSASRAGFELRRKIFENHWFAVEGEYGYTEYNDNFPEYDGAGIRAGASWRWSGPVYLKLTYVYRTYDARGCDMENETKENSDESDISYVEDRIEGYVSRDLELRGNGLVIGPSFDLSRRFYSSEKDFLDDYIHVARRDLRADIGPFIRWKAPSEIDITLSCDFTIRDADSPYYNLDPVKDYNRARFALRAEYSIR